MKARRADRAGDEWVFHRGQTVPLICSRFVRDYNAINHPDVHVRVPSEFVFASSLILEKVSTAVKVESKVWFANERTFISYLSMGLLLSTIASGLLFGARDSAARYFALAYAAM